MTTGIHVMADGSVHCGGNQWFSLEQIQQAVLETQNSDLHESLTTSEGQMQTVNLNKKKGKTTANKSDEQHLELPSTFIRNEQPKDACSCQRKQTANDDGEHLPLPSTRE